jgi:hypothetical protein
MGNTPYCTNLNVGVGISHIKLQSFFITYGRQRSGYRYCDITSNILHIFSMLNSTKNNSAATKE